MQKPSIFEPVLAPVPRYLMRLDCIARLLDTHPLPHIRNFLEIGPGMGDVAAHLLQRYPETKGQLLEFSDTAAHQLKQRFACNERLCISTQDLSTASLTSHFDLILAFEVLEHIENDLSALQHIHAALKPGGIVLISVPAFMKKWQKVDNWAGHYRRYEKQELQDKLTDTGFKIHFLWCYGFPVTNLVYPLRQLYYRASHPKIDHDSKQLASQQSGIHRPLHAPGWSPWLARLMTPLFVMQHSTRHSNLGDGWIVLAQKPA